jgi:hypothetical protein
VASAQWVMHVQPDGSRLDALTHCTGGSAQCFTSHVARTLHPRLACSPAPAPHRAHREPVPATRFPNPHHRLRLRPSRKSPLHYSCTSSFLCTTCLSRNACSCKAQQQISHESTRPAAWPSTSSWARQSSCHRRSGTPTND